MTHIKNKNDLSNGLASIDLYNISFTVFDLDKSIEWYTNILGFKLIKKLTFNLPLGKADSAIMKGAGIKLELLHVPGEKRIDEMFAPAPQHLIPIGNKGIVFQVEDIKVASEELAIKGVNFVWREHNLVENGMLSSMIEDYDGNKINIFQRNTTI